MICTDTVVDVNVTVSNNGEFDETLKWNPDADLDGNGAINISDLIIIATNFGKTW